jgi:hypothetical protein
LCRTRTPSSTIMKQKGGFKTFSGPTIRERLLYNESGPTPGTRGISSSTRLRSSCSTTPSSPPSWRPCPSPSRAKTSSRTAAPTRSRTSWRSTSRRLKPSCRTALSKTCTRTAQPTNQIGGLQMAIPTTPTNSYGGIDRNAQPSGAPRPTTPTRRSRALRQVSSTTVKTIFDNVMIARSRGTKGPEPSPALRNTTSPIPRRRLRSSASTMSRAGQDGLHGAQILRRRQVRGRGS